ncbi:MAG TPA: GDSL-type esterase/lipase family protein [Rhodopila sp.]|nr:GDSL-type esterase/lipase family protein [Rhodopila sp.]
MKEIMRFIATPRWTAPNLSAAFMRLTLGSLMLAAATLSTAKVSAAGSDHWVASWTASVQGPYPSGVPVAQPDMAFAFPSAASGANDQSFRLVIHPGLLGHVARLRFSNAYGTKPVTLDGVHVGLQAIAGTIVPGTNETVHFAGKPSVTIPVGGEMLSDPVTLSFVHDPNAPELQGRKLAVSFHVAGQSGPMTWHAKAMTTSYVGQPGAGSHGAETSDAAFPFSTTSWYFLDALEVMAPRDTHVVVAFGDSITDGTASTINGDDRWPDVLQRRLQAAFGHRFVVVNEGIGGNQVAGPAEYTAASPIAGGPSAGERLQRDVLSLPGVSTVVWLEGINDFGTAHVSAETVEQTMRAVVERLRKGIPHVRVIGATLTPAFHSTLGDYGTPDVDNKRQALNKFIVSNGVFDGVVNFAAVTTDPATGGLKPEFKPNSSVGGPGEGLHPNRAGYQAMGNSIDPTLIAR